MGSAVTSHATPDADRTYRTDAAASDRTTAASADASDRASAASAVAAADRILARTIHGIWPSLPALLIASAATCVAAVTPVLASPGINPGALLFAAVIVAPFVGAMAATVNTIASCGAATIRDWRRGLGELWLFAIRQALVPAAIGSLFLAALEVWQRHRTGWVIPSFVLTGAGTVLAVAGLLAVLPLGVMRPGLRGARLWMTGLYLVARQPARFGAALVVVFVGVWAATEWSASILLLVPAPATTVMVVAVRAAIADAGLDSGDLTE